MKYKVVTVRSVETACYVVAHSGKQAVALAQGKRPERRAFRQTVRAVFRAHGDKRATLIPVYTERE